MADDGPTQAGRAGSGAGGGTGGGMEGGAADGDLGGAGGANRGDRRGWKRRRGRWWRGIGLFATLFVGFIGLMGGLGAFTFGYAKGASYLRNDPKACANCHVMQDHFDAWVKSSHHAVATCNDCHLPHNFVGKWWVKGDNGFFHSLAFTLENYHDPIQIKPRNRRVTQNACLHCHGETVHEMLPVSTAGLGGETRSGAASGMLLCAGCHADVGHAGRRRAATTFVPQDPYRKPE